MIEISLSTVVFAIVGILVVLFAMLIYLLIRKRLEQMKRSKVENIKNQIQPLVYSELTKGEVSTLSSFQHKEGFHEALVDILESIEEMFDDESFEKPISSIAEEYLLEHINERLDSNRWSNRMNALYMIKDFEVYQYLERLLTIYKSEKTSQQERNVILQILAMSGHPQAVDILTTKPPYRSNFFFKQIVRSLPDHHFQLLLDRFHDLEKPLQVAILSYISEKRMLSYLSFVEDCIQSEDSEIRINALKAVRDIGYMKNSEALLAFYQSENWVEQMMFAQTAGALGDEAFTNSLIHLLASHQWWVRYYAGEAITQLKNGTQILDKISKEHEDSFARDMASQWLGSV